MRIKGKTGSGIAGGAAGMALAVSFIGGWEGLRTNAYWDAMGGVWTACYGETRGIEKGDKFTVAQCDAMLAEGISDFERGLDRCLKVDVPIETKVAFVSWAYNVGLGAACKSTLVRKANAGDLHGACNELPRWNRAGGRVIRGLSNRRGAERRLCKAGLA